MITPSIDLASSREFFAFFPADPPAPKLPNVDAFQDRAAFRFIAGRINPGAEHDSPVFFSRFNPNEIGSMVLFVAGFAAHETHGRNFGREANERSELPVVP